MVLTLPRNTTLHLPDHLEAEEAFEEAVVGDAE